MIQSRDFFPTERDRLADPVSEILPELRESMIVSLPAAPGEAWRVCFMRHGGRSFTERDRQIAALLRPHLQEIWLDAERRRAGVPQLTQRAWEVLALAAGGMPYAAIAEQLSSPSAPCASTWSTSGNGSACTAFRPPRRPPG